MFMQDGRVASTDFNIQPAMATGVTNPYGGLNGIMSTLLLPTNQMSIKDNATPVDYIFVIGVDYIKIGTNMPWALEIGKNPQQKFNTQLMMKGMYGAIRKEEAAVVVIETAHVDSSLLPLTTNVRKK
jgi:hypothetical protein